MSVLDNAKAALAPSDYEPTNRVWHEQVQRMRHSLSALIAEHERVLAERAAPQEWEYGVRRSDGVTVRAASERHARILVRDDVRYKTWTAVRRPKQPVLPWEPLPEDTNQTEGENR